MTTTSTVFLLEGFSTTLDWVLFSVHATKEGAEKERDCYIDVSVIPRPYRVREVLLRE